MLTTKFLKPKGKSDTKHLGSLKGSSSGLVIANLANDFSGLTLVIANNTTSAEKLRAETEVYAHSDLPIFSFPDWETLPFDNFSPHQDIISQRLLTLYRLPQTKTGVLIIPVSTLMHRTAPPAYVQGHSLVLSKGQQFDINNMRTVLEQAGYNSVDTVYEHGEYAVRGSLMDIFPMGLDDPVRIDLFDDEIDTLRTFNPDNQRSLEQLDRIEVLPAKEFPLTQDGINTFRQKFREEFDVSFKDCPVYQDVSTGLAPAGIEYYLPLFFEELASVLSYLPENTQVIHQSEIETAMDRFLEDAESRYENRRHDILQPICKPNSLFLAKDEIFGAIKTLPQLVLHQDTISEKAGRENFACEVPKEYPIDSRLENPLNALESFLLETDHRVLFAAESAGRRESLLDLLGRIRLTPTIFETWQEFLNSKESAAIVVAPIEHGLTLPQDKVTLITESQLFGQTQVMQRRRRKASKEASDNLVKNLTELRIDAPVVHLDHGVGRYRGLQTLEVDGNKEEFLTLEYASGSKLYVPVSNLHLIARYSGGAEDHAPLHKLGTEKWSAAKRKAAEKIRDVAAELLDIYARRNAQVGFSFPYPKEDYDIFAAGFPFEETPDQAQAIHNVIMDMQSQRPMDRLVCGDVGFGKTEVAMRATFMAVQSGKQVAVLVPTTLLAQQHFENFQDRFADWPVKVEVLSRFRTGKQTDQILAGIEEGKVDIVVGTHKLIQQKLKFKNMGLLIIDEEHRFGVQQKERIKSFRSQVDILTLTATPIPRTLNMAMASIRDLSIIATPPAKRLSVKTFVRQHDNAQVKEAILREILRGGQVYYLHNDIATIEKTAKKIEELVPEARVVIGHGQMNERQLERVMSDFYHKRFNVLVCTTIIETGIDVPTANTIIIDRADKFGLAQLHQLRGRVGRSHHQAYAYLLTPPPKTLTKDAEKRLLAIEEAHDLGAGFTLATHDLEIRGAGELLGEEQSGHIEGIGFSLYMEMLERAVKAIREGKEPNLDKPLDTGAEISLHIPAMIPEDYIPDVNSRLTLYKRISNTSDGNELKEMQVEMIDRFGLLPDPVKNLFQLTELRHKVEPLGIDKIDAGPKGGTITFSQETTIDPFTIIQLVQAMPDKFKLNRGDQVKFEIESSTATERFGTIDQIIKLLTKKPS